MSNLLGLRNRLRTIKSLNSVMRAILLITASKTQKVKKRFLHLSKYSDAVLNMAKGICPEALELLDNELVIVVGTNEGLCGNFNEKVISYVDSFMGSRNSKFELCLLGKNLSKLKKKNIPVAIENPGIIKSRAASDVSQLAKQVYDWYLSKQGKVFVVYNQYKSVLMQKPVKFQLLPIDGCKKSDEYLIEENAEDIFGHITIFYIESMLCKIIVESELGELNARMVLVKGAADTSGELISSLTIGINKARQAIITSELAEIVSSFEALGKGEE